VVDEWLALRRGVALFIPPDRSLFEISGPDHLSFMHNLTTNAVTQLAIGDGCRSLLLQKNGRLIADMRLLRLEDSLLALLDQRMIPTALETLQAHLISEQVSLNDLAASFSLVSIIGPETPTLFNEFALPFPAINLASTVATVAEVSLLIVRYDQVGEQGALLIVPSEHQQTIRNDFLARGHPIGLVPISDGALDIARIEAAEPRYQIDFDESNLPLQLGFDAAIDQQKGCYLGQEVIARVIHLGHVGRRLAGFVLEQLVPAGTPILHGNEQRGLLTSTTFSRALNRPIGLGMLRYQDASVGNRLEVVADGVRKGVTVHEIPFYRPGGGA